MGLSEPELEELGRLLRERERNLLSTGAERLQEWCAEDMSRSVCISLYHNVVHVSAPCARGLATTLDLAAEDFFRHMERRQRELAEQRETADALACLVEDDEDTQPGVGPITVPRGGTV
jgi:hypothetical protein